jgi:hypothetical protein
VECKRSRIHGKGIFAIEDLQKNEVIEICPIIVLDQKETRKINDTSLYDYYFSWQDSASSIALGYGSIYNHSYQPNAEYSKDFLNNRITFIAIKPIRKGEEITVNYNGDPDDQEPVWFEKDGIG